MAVDASIPLTPEDTARLTDFARACKAAARAVMLRLGDSHLEIFEFSSPAPKPGDPDRPACDHGITHICLEVRDSQAEYARLKAAGMRFHAPPQAQEGGFVTYGRDPDGNIVELQSWAPVR